MKEASAFNHLSWNTSHLWKSLHFHLYFCYASTNQIHAADLPAQEEKDEPDKKKANEYCRDEKTEICCWKLN